MKLFLKGSREKFLFEKCDRLGKLKEGKALSERSDKTQSLSSSTNFL